MGISLEYLGAAEPPSKTDTVLSEFEFIKQWTTIQQTSWILHVVDLPHYMQTFWAGTFFYCYALISKGTKIILNKYLNWIKLLDHCSLMNMELTGNSKES